MRAYDENVTSEILPCAWNETINAARAVHAALGQARGPVVITWHLASDNPERLQALVRAFLAQQEHAAGAPAWRFVVQARWVDVGQVHHLVRAVNATTDMSTTVARIWLDILFLSMGHACVFVSSGFPQVNK